MFLNPGTIIDGKYEIRGTIGSGGMGVIYEAYQASVDRLVAVKLLTYATTGSSSDLQRFEREAIILSRLSHPNIVQFLGYGLWEHYPYIVMERLTGISLQKLLGQSESPAQAESLKVLPIAIQICEALHHAHAEGVLHRDIKPSNIILTEQTASTEPIAKLIDFGLARLTGIDGRQKLTQTGMAIGSVQYMSPEQCAGQVVDGRTDIYSLGCVLYECFTGEPPFTADNGVAMMFQHLNEPVTATAKWNTLNSAQQHILAKCLAKRQQHRYASAAELRDDLIDLSSDLAPRSAPAPTESSPAQPAGKRNLSRIAGIVALLAVTAGLCIIITMNNSGLAPREDTLSGVQVDELMKQAGAYYSASDDEHAIGALTRVNEFVAAHPTEVSDRTALDAKRQLGSIYLYHLHQPEKALPLFTGARTISKKFGAVAESESLRLASDALRYMGKKDEALNFALQSNTLLQDNLKRTPKSGLSAAELSCAEGWRQVGACYQDLGKLREAEVDRRNAWKSAQISGNKYQLLWATRELSYNLADFGKFKEADTVLDTVLRPGFDKNNLPPEQRNELSQCYAHRGNLRRELGDTEGSLRGFEKALEYARNFSSPYGVKGLLLYQALNFYFLKKRDEGDKALAEADRIRLSDEQLDALRKRVIEARPH